MEELFDDLTMDEDLTELTKGFPSQLSLTKVSKHLREASQELLADLPLDKTDKLSYGPTRGSPEYLEQLATFLSEGYGEKVDSASLFCTGSASYGLSLAASLFLRTGSPVFIEDPSYFIAISILRDELDMKIYPVPVALDGMDTAELDRLATQLANEVPFSPTPQRPFRAIVYMIPTCHNPTGICYSAEKCQELIRLARKHSLLLFCDDVYNLLHFGSGSAPQRLLSFDKRSDPDFVGNVISNGTFSKYMAPALRLGWIEAAPRIINILCKSMQILSGGSPSHYTSQIVALALRKGLVQKHLAEEKKLLKEKLITATTALYQHLPEEVHFETPQGGYFLWLRLPQGCKAAEVAKHSKDKYKVTVLPGNVCSPTGSHTNCIRVSFSYLPRDQLAVAVKKLCDAIRDCLAK